MCGLFVCIGYALVGSVGRRSPSFEVIMSFFYFSRVKSTLHAITLGHLNFGMFGTQSNSNFLVK